MGYTHFDKVSGINGVGVGAKDAEITVADSSGNLYIQGVQITANAAELNAAAGTGVDSTELGFLDGATAGTQVASKAVIADANVNIGITKVTELHIGATGAETQVTSTAAELNILDGVTSDAAELNLLDGVTATTAEINKSCDYISGSDTWDPGSIADGDEEAKEVTATGAALGDFVLASFSLDVSDLVLNAQVTAADTVTCILANNTGGAIDLGSGTISVRVFKA